MKGGESRLSSFLEQQMKKNSRSLTKKNSAFKQAEPRQSVDLAEQRLLILGLISELRSLAKSMKKAKPANIRQMSFLREEIRRAFRSMYLLNNSLFLATIQSTKKAISIAKSDEEE